MEIFDLRDLVEDEVKYRDLSEDIIDNAVRYIKNDELILQMLDNIVDQAINAVNDAE